MKAQTLRCFQLFQRHLQLSANSARFAGNPSVLTAGLFIATNEQVAFCNNARLFKSVGPKCPVLLLSLSSVPQRSPQVSRARGCISRRPDACRKVVESYLAQLRIQ